MPKKPAAVIRRANVMLTVNALGARLLQFQMLAILLKMLSIFLMLSFHVIILVKWKKNSSQEATMRVIIMEKAKKDTMEKAKKATTRKEMMALKNIMRGHAA